jgi:hypothetical protein
VGEAYLDSLDAFLDRYRGQWRADRRSLLLACYNAGPARVRRAGFDLAGLPASTRDYVRRAGALHDVLLAQTPAAQRLARAAGRSPRPAVAGS